MRRLIGMHRALGLLAVALFWISCKPAPSHTSSDDGGEDNLAERRRDAAVDAPAIDAPAIDAPTIDAPGGGGQLPPGCSGPLPGMPQCSNCIDDDGDGHGDSLDVECSHPLDNDESSFATGIPGDNMDAINQDCFFDGNSGAGDDGCNIHVCCLLGAQTAGECPIGAIAYDPSSCPPPIGITPLSQMCIATCGPLTVPGCDCFGCCTLCDRATNQCFDVATNPNTSPGCTLETASDPDICKRCTKVTSCGNSACGGDNCVLCPGQDPSDLPPSCGGTTSCPSGVQSCASGAACPAGSYCHAGSQCCVTIIL